MANAPPSFLCPISLEIMKDPVTVCTGQTYDRENIERWLQIGNHTCPVTMLRLNDLTLIPNLIVRRLIQAWCAEHDRKQSLRLCSEVSHQNVDVRGSVLAILRKIAAGNDIKVAMKGLKQLAREREESAPCIVETGGTLLLVSLLWVEQPDMLHEACEACDEVLYVLRLLSRSHPDARLLVMEPQNRDAIIWHLINGCLSARVSATALLKVLLRYEDSSISVRNYSQIVQGFVELLREDLNVKAEKAVVKALEQACLREMNRAAAVQAGAIGVLVDVIGKGRTVTTERALSALELLCRTNEGKFAACRHPYFFPTLLDKMIRVSNLSSELASICMLEVCKLGRLDALHTAKKNGACRQLLLVLQSNGTPRAKCKAQELLKLLYSVFGWEE